MTLIDLQTSLQSPLRGTDAVRDTPAVRAALTLLVARIGPFSLTDSDDWDLYYQPLQRRASAGLPITLRPDYANRDIDATLHVYDAASLPDPNNEFSAACSRHKNVYLVAYDHTQKTATLTHAHDRASQEELVGGAMMRLRRAIALWQEIDR